MNYATVCSGVEAMSLAVRGMGWNPIFFSEIEPFPCQLLAERFPNVPNVGDMTKIKGDKYHGTIDVFAGGTPCQSFSVAGKRGGLEDARGQLMLNFVRLAYETGAKYVVWENVVGVLSSNNGEDFATLLSSLCGYDVSVPAKGWKNSGVVTNADGCYGVAWRVLDAQFTRVPGFERAVPQRRRRVWVVGYLGDWRRAAEVLFVGESLPWNPPPCGCEREEAARGAEGCPGTASGFNFEMYSGDCKGIAPCLQHDRAGDTLTYKTGQVAATLPTTCHDYSRADDFNMVPSCATKQQAQNIGHNVAMPVMANDYKEPQVVCFQQNTRDEVRFISGDGKIAGCLSAEAGMKQQNYIASQAVCYENHANDSRVTESGDMSPTITSRAGTGGGNPPLIAISDVIHGDKACNGKGWSTDGAGYTLDTMATQGVCFGFRPNNSAQSRSLGEHEELCPTLPSEESGNKGCVATNSTVRRLTPMECEKLMGFPPLWTQIPWRGKPADQCPDAPRYKACGNSWAVNCARWVMMRIQQSEDKHNGKETL